MQFYLIVHGPTHKGEYHLHSERVPEVGETILLPGSEPVVCRVTHISGGVVGTSTQGAELRTILYAEQMSSQFERPSVVEFYKRRSADKDF